MKEISIKKAVVINAAAKYTTVIIQLIYIAILSRLLTPEEFGIVAVIQVFVMFFQLVADMGFGPAVVQNKALTKAEINDIFSCSVYIGLVLMVIFIAVSFPISAIYNNSIYVPLGIILSFSLMLSAFNMIPNAIMLKEKRFLKIAVRTITVALITFAVTVVLALNGFGVYALVAHAVLNSLGLFIWNEISTKLRFKVKPNLASLKKILSYSVYQFGAQTLNFFNRNLDNLLIGKFFSKQSLGYYDKAYTLMRYPISYLPGVITPALHPILSEHQHDPDYIYRRYMQVLKFLSLIGCFVSAFGFFAGREIILTVFGDQWVNSIVPFRILSLSLWMQMLTNTTASIYQSLGNTKLLFKSTVAATVLIISAIVIGITVGNITAVAICVSAAYFLNFFMVFLFLVKGGFKKSFIGFLKTFWQELLIVAVLILVALFWPWLSGNVVTDLLIKTACMGVVYIVLLLILKQHRVFQSIFGRNKRAE